MWSKIWPIWVLFFFGLAIKNDKQKGEVQLYDKQKGQVQVLFVKGMLTKHVENILTKILNQKI